METMMHISLEVALAIVIFTVVVILVLKRQIEVDKGEAAPTDTVGTKGSRSNYTRLAIIKAEQKEVLINVNKNRVSTTVISSQIETKAQI